MAAQSVLAEAVEEVHIQQVLVVEIVLLGMLDIDQIPVRVGNSFLLAMLEPGNFQYLLEHSWVQKAKTFD